MNPRLINTFVMTSLLALSACVETTSPLCNVGNKMDVAGFEKTYNFSLLGSADEDLQESKVQVVRSGVGAYQMGGQSVTTCQLGQWTVVESPTKAGTYQQNILSLDPHGVTTFNQLITDAKSLTAAGISYQIVDRPVSAVRSKWLRMLGRQTQQTEKVLIINTDSPQASAGLIQLAKPMGAGFHHFRNFRLNSRESTKLLFRRCRSLGAGIRFSNLYVWN